MHSIKKLQLRKKTILQLTIANAEKLYGGTSDDPPQSTGKICNTSTQVPNTMRGIPFTYTIK
jgi:hypothetical protein